MAGEPIEPELDLEDQEVSIEVESTVDGDVDADISVEDLNASSEEDQFEKANTSTQKRINQLTKKMRQAEREREEAVRFATQVQTESSALKTHIDQLDNNYVNEFSGRVQSELSSAEGTLKNAIEIGDTDGVVAAQRQITALAIQADRAAQAQRSAEMQRQHADLQRQQMQQQPAQAAQPPRRPDPKAESWASKRDWFGKDETMTYAAFGIHKQLIEDEGFDPAGDDYYSELDKRMADAFPHKFKNGNGGRRPAQTVASVNRSASGRGKRQVRLTATQVTMAKKLGVPLEEYAKYVKD